MLPSYLVQADIRALAGVCVTLWVMFRPLMEFKVTITPDDFPKYALQKALVVTRTSTIRDSVVQVNIGRGFYTSNNSLWSYKFISLLSLALYTLVNAIPAMQHLHTIQLSSILLSRIYLYTILSSPHLIHLILHNVPLPKMSTFPPPTLRKLTLRVMKYPWESVQPLIAQLATSLEYLDVHRCIFLPPSQLQLPSFPCLQELRYRQDYPHITFSDKNQLNELLRLASRVTHLHVSGHDEPVTACRRNLQHLSTILWMLSDDIFGTEPFLRLMHLSIRFTQSTDALIHPPTLSSFIRNRFPAITSLHLTIPWSFRNCAMVMAQSQYNVRALELVVVGIEYAQSMERPWYLPVEVLDDQLHHAKLPAALQAVTLEAVQHGSELERGITRCIQWVLDDVIPPVTGLGGIGLKSISVVVSQPKSRSVERGRVFSRQWVRAPDDVWQVLE